MAYANNNKNTKKCNRYSRTSGKNKGEPAVKVKKSNYKWLHGRSKQVKISTFFLETLAASFALLLKMIVSQRYHSNKDFIKHVFFYNNNVHCTRSGREPEN